MQFKLVKVSQAKVMGNELVNLLAIASMNLSTHTPDEPSQMAPSLSANAPHRPSSVVELAGRVQDDLQWDPSNTVMHWLRAGEKCRRAGKRYAEIEDFESAFVEYAKAAIIVLEKLPTHPDFTIKSNVD
jgi:hypothetical protein